MQKRRATMAVGIGRMLATALALNAALPTALGFASRPSPFLSRARKGPEQVAVADGGEGGRRARCRLRQRRQRGGEVLVAVAMGVGGEENAHEGRVGRITLIGAGPGDPELLTVKAMRALQQEDCLVIADRLVSDEILELVRGELRVARKLPGCADKAQREIYEWVREGVMGGRDVVRLKIGDPFVFGRGGEEILEFRSTLGIDCEVIPGVSAAFSSPLLGNIPVTHRGVANQVVMSTGFGKNYDIPNLQPYNTDQTAVFLMAVGRLSELCERLMSEAGYPLDCPVAIIERASCPDQRLVLGKITTIADMALLYEVKAPATIVFGDVVTVLHGDKQGLVDDVGFPNSPRLAQGQEQGQGAVYTGFVPPSPPYDPRVPSPSEAASSSPSE